MECEDCCSIMKYIATLSEYAELWQCSKCKKVQVR